MLDRKNIKSRAKSVLGDNYGIIIGTFAVYNVIIFFICLAANFIPFLGWIINVLLMPIFMIGYMNLLVRLYRGEKVYFQDMFNGFQNFGHNLGGYWYMYLFIFLWTLLLYIPGIIKGYAYFMAPYILMDQPEIGATEALEKSKQMTNGHKMDLFVMHLSFLGWFLLCIPTFGLLSFFFVTPYMMLTNAGYYVVLRNQEIHAHAAYSQTTYAQPTYTQPDYYQPQSAYNPMNNISNVPNSSDSNPYLDYNQTNETPNENPYMQDMGNDQV